MVQKRQDACNKQIDLMFFPLSIKSCIEYAAKMWTDIWEFPKNDKKQNNVVFTCLKRERMYLVDILVDMQSIVVSIKCTF